MQEPRIAQMDVYIARSGLQQYVCADGRVLGIFRVLHDGTLQRNVFCNVVAACRRFCRDGVCARPLRERNSGRSEKQQ